MWTSTSCQSKIFTTTFGRLPRMAHPRKANSSDRILTICSAIGKCCHWRDFADNLWGEIEEPVLQALRHRTYEYASATAKMRVAYACRQIQWLEYHRSNVGDQPGLRMRIQKQTSIVHTEITKTTAVDATYIAKYPADGLRYVGKVIKRVQWLSFAMNLPGEMEDFRERILDYLSDVWNQRDLAAPALLSLKIQEFLSSIPGMPGGLISTTTPIFDPCPLGFYEGGSGSWQDCLWPY